jgi:hypothetical protein
MALTGACTKNWQKRPITKNTSFAGVRLGFDSYRTHGFFNRRWLQKSIRKTANRFGFENSANQVTHRQQRHPAVQWFPFAWSTDRVLPVAYMTSASLVSIRTWATVQASPCACTALPHQRMRLHAMAAVIPPGTGSAVSAARPAHQTSARKRRPPHTTE